jgi:hypothetical protein
MRLFLLLFIVAVTLCACQNPGRFQAPQIETTRASEEFAIKPSPRTTSRSLSILGSQLSITEETFWKWERN